jgi:hypothetical protein
VAISIALPPSGAIGENPDDLLSLSLSPSYHDDLPSLGAAVPSHGHESTMHWDPVVVPWFIDPIHDFSYTKIIPRNLRKCQIVGKPLEF